MNAMAVLDRRVAAAEADVLAARQAIIEALQSHIAIRARTIVIDDAGLAQELDDRLNEAKDALADVIERRERAHELMAQIREHDIETLHRDINLCTAILKTNRSHVWNTPTHRCIPTDRQITEQDRKSFQAKLDAAQGEMAEVESLQRRLEILATAE